MTEVILQVTRRAELLSRATFLPLFYAASVLFSLGVILTGHVLGQPPSVLPSVIIPNVSFAPEKVWVGGCAADLKSRRFLGNEAHSVNTFIQHKSTEAPQCANHHAKQ